VWNIREQEWAMGGQSLCRTAKCPPSYRTASIYHWWLAMKKVERNRKIGRLDVAFVRCEANKVSDGDKEEEVCAQSQDGARQK
jgi:murein L,D-transpeptidase YafK